jgi:uncharacterized protein (DUF362 family)
VRATEPLTQAWKRLEAARRIVIKFNMMKLPERLFHFQGRRRELVDDEVCRAVLRLLRERTDADIVATDTNAYTPEHLMGDDFNYAGLLAEFGVPMVDSNTAPFRDYEVPGGGSIFDRYTLSACFEGAEVVSVAKMKNHKFMGITLTTKNLFGLPPMIPPAGRTRAYYHHLVRLPYVLTDLAMITDPALNIIEALTGQWGAEWNGEGRICDALVAGDHSIATDACGATLMGHDPTSDYPTPPFRRDRNHLLIAAERGYGTVDMDRIDFRTEVAAPLTEFDSIEMDPPETVASWLKTTAEQGLLYREERDTYLDRHRGEFIFLQAGNVVWHGEDPGRLGSRRDLSGVRKDQALWLKLVDEQEREGERFEVYEQTLARF